MKIMIRSDIEGVTGVTTYAEAEHSDLGLRMLMNDLNACIDGIRSTGNHEIVIYDEHTDGRNVCIDNFPENVSVICGKPNYRIDWGGIDTSFDLMMMIGFHARSGTKGALLPHSYSRKNLNIRVNDIDVGEIGMEAMIAGDFNVPLILVSGDSAGMVEAESIVPGVKTVVVKEALGEYEALCYPPEKTYKMIFKAAAESVKSLKEITPFLLKIPPPVDFEIDIADSDYLKDLSILHPNLFITNNTVRIIGSSVTEAWSQYCSIERSVKK
jgi:D-amino peptidase